MAAPLTKPVLRTERMTLAPMSWDDYADECALDSDPEVMRSLDEPRSPQVVHARMSEWLEGTNDRLGMGFWVGRESGGSNAAATFLGWWLLEPAGAGAEIGWRLARAAWGRGLATEGARALLHYAFTGLGLDHVHAETMAANTRSRSVMHKLGMSLSETWVQEWERPLPGHEQGEVRYRLTREEWARRGLA